MNEVAAQRSSRLTFATCLPIAAEWEVRYDKDFGQAFYLTTDRNQALEVASALLRPTSGLLQRPDGRKKEGRSTEEASEK